MGEGSVSGRGGRPPEAGEGKDGVPEGLQRQHRPVDLFQVSDLQNFPVTSEIYAFFKPVKLQ